MDEQMAAWMKYADPAEEHEFLRKLAGKWNAKVRWWMGPDGPPQESEGTSTNELLFEGRFLQSKFEGNTPFGPFQGLALDGYDRINRRYSGVWMDSMGTMMMVFSGQADGKARTMTCEYTDPMTMKPTTMKAVTTLVSDTEHHYESWATGPDGKVFKNMEIVYTR